MTKWFDFHKAEEEPLSLWPLDDEPVMWYEGKLPDWDNDPPTFSLLWRPNSVAPIRIPGRHLPTNLLGRTVAEVFADFPTDFYDSPSPTSSPSLSPVSPLFPPSPIDEEEHDHMSIELDASIDEMSQQLADRIHLDSPPRSPSPLLISESLDIPHEAPLPLPPSSPMFNPLSINSASDRFSSSSSTLSVGTSSAATSTYAVSPSPRSFSNACSPAPGLRRSPRRSPPVPNPVVVLGEPYNELHTPRDLDSTMPALNQIVLEEYPQDPQHRRTTKRTGTYSEDDEDFDDPLVDADARPRKRTTAQAAPKRHPCTVPGCTESFTRLNDVLRHIKNAAIHKGTTQQAEALAASSTLCKYCGEELSRADAARRHELKASCGKRTIRRKPTYSMLPA